MTMLSKALLGTSLALALSVPALAKDKAAPAAPVATNTAANGAAIVKGIGILNVDAAVANADAYRVAQQQQQVTYKPQMDAARARQTALETQIKTLVDKLKADIAAKKPEALLQQQYAQIQQLQNNGKQEIEGMLAPLAQSDAYVKEQIADQLDQAVQNAMAKQGVSIVLQPGAVVARAQAYELTDDVIVELNALIPAAKMQLVPPAGWMPRQLREQQAQQPAAAAQPAPAARPAPTDGR